MEIPFKQILEAIDKKQRKSLYPLEEFKKRPPLGKLPTGSSGLYWFWTNHTPEELMRYKKPKKNSGEVPISKLVSQRHDLTHIYREINNEGFYVVYNGIGGRSSKSVKSGLRKRINQELFCKNEGTGTLNLLNRFEEGSNHEENWRISYFDFEDDKNEDILEPLKSTNAYKDFAPTLELLWRIEYGIPILTRH